MTDQLQKIKAVKIWLNRAEGPTSECGEITFENVNVWERADKMLATWCETSPKDGSYDKVDFTVIFEDGEDYRGRLDLKHWSIQSPSVAKHMVSFLTFYAGRTPENELPKHLSPAKYAEILNRQPDMVELSKQWLDSYEIG